MSYSRRQLYAMGEPLGDGATRREVGGKIIYGTGGGGGTPDKQTTVVDVPDYAKPYVKESLGRAAALTDPNQNPYQTYGGERVAQFNPMQKQAFGRAQGQEVASQIGAGSGLAGTAGLMGLTGGYQPGQFGSQMNQYMSPYMDAVTQRQMDSAQRQADIASTQRGAQAVRAGAFGGSRQAIQDAEAARALASQKGQIQETGLQSAFDRAQQQFNAEQSLAEQSRQAGLSTAISAAGQLGQLGQQQFGQQMDITGQQSRFGDQQRAATQDILSQQYQDFLNQQRAPYDQLSFMNSILRGTPMGQTTTQYQPPANQTSQLIGLATAGAGAYGAYKGNAAGGEVNSYAAGGKLNLEGTFEVADGGGGLGSLGGGGVFNNMQQGGIGAAQMPQQPMLFSAQPAVMPRGGVMPQGGRGFDNMMMGGEASIPNGRAGIDTRMFATNNLGGGNYAAGGIASLNQPELSAMAGGMSDEQLAQASQSPVNPELAKMTLAAEAQQRAQLREQSKAMQAKGSMTNITSTLANMPDEQLQQYAKLNKGDPYIMALVVAEADRRKKGGMPTEEAPTVVAQQIASMDLPEEQGIAQLPVGNMDFAGGGIIAFAKGDEVLSTEELLERQREEDRKRIQGAFQTLKEAGYGAGSALLDVASMPARGAAGAIDTSVVRPLRAAGLDLGYISPMLVPEGSDPSSMTPYYDMLRAGRQEGGSSSGPTTPAAQPAAGLDAAIMADEARKRAPGQAAAVAEQAAVASAAEQAEAEAEALSRPPGIAGIGNVTGMMDQEQARRIAAQAEIDEQRAADVATARGELSEEEKMAREFGSEREARLKKQEEGFDKSEKNNLNMTLIDIGLAMMAGKSPNALQNIAAGAQQGLKGFETRLSKIQSGREKVDESMARLAEIRQEKLSAVGAEKRRLNALERQTLTESKTAQEAIASAFADKKITLTADQARQANTRSFEIWKFTQETEKAAKIQERQEAQALSVNLREIAKQASNSLRDLQPGDPDYIALAAQRDQALAQLAQLSGLGSSVDLSGFGKAQVVN